MTVGDRIRNRRLSLEMTQDELAQKTGYKSRSSINKIESSRNLPLSKVEQMAKALNCAPSLLMGWEDTEDVTDDMVSEHIELISKWIRLSPEKQKAVMDIIDALNGEGE